MQIPVTPASLLGSMTEGKDPLKGFGRHSTNDAGVEAGRSVEDGLVGFLAIVEADGETKNSNILVEVSNTIQFDQRSGRSSLALPVAIIEDPIDTRSTNVMLIGAEEPRTSESAFFPWSAGAAESERQSKLGILSTAAGNIDSEKGLATDNIDRAVEGPMKPGSPSQSTAESVAQMFSTTGQETRTGKTQERPIGIPDQTMVAKFEQTVARDAGTARVGTAVEFDPISENRRTVSTAEAARLPPVDPSIRMLEKSSEFRDPDKTVLGQAANTVSPGTAGRARDDAHPDVLLQTSADAEKPPEMVSATQPSLRDGNRSVVPAFDADQQNPRATEKQSELIQSARMQPLQKALNQSDPNGTSPGLSPSSATSTAEGTRLPTETINTASLTAGADTSHANRRDVNWDGQGQIFSNVQTAAVSQVAVAVDTSIQDNGDATSPQELELSAPMEASKESKTAPIRSDWILNRPETARLVSQQLIAASASLADGPVQLTLDPVELGRVSLTLSTSDGAMTVIITAERPETLDALRRNIDLLATDFSSIGYDSLSFEFGAQHERTPADQDAEVSDPRIARIDSEDQNSPTSINRIDLSAEDRLDIRV